MKPKPNKYFNPLYDMVVVCYAQPQPSSSFPLVREVKDNPEMLLESINVGYQYLHALPHEETNDGAGGDHETKEEQLQQQYKSGDVDADLIHWQPHGGEGAADFVQVHFSVHLLTATVRQDGVGRVHKGNRAAVNGIRHGETVESPHESVITFQRTEDSHPSHVLD